MNFSSIRFRLISAFFAIGLVLFLFIIIVVPGQTKATAEKVMVENVAFTVKLLSDNLALGMQTRELDQGAALQQTLDLLKGDVIASVAVLDQNKVFVKGLKAVSARLNKDTLVSEDKMLRVFRAMKDSDGKIQGYVEITFSKKSFIESVNRFMVFIWIAGIIMLIAVILTGLILSNRIIKPLGNSIQMIKDIAEGEGDLTLRLPMVVQDELGKQAHWINVFIEKLQVMVGAIKQNADQLNSVSEKLEEVSSETSDLAANMKGKAENSSQVMTTISDSLQDVKKVSHETSLAVKNIAVAIEEMSSSIGEVARNCQEESAIATKADDMASTAKKLIKTLEGMAHQIGKVVEMIQDIADKTKLLSLNATIQAASAGEAGRGFSVVANEIKELAHQTSNATNDIQKEILNMRQTVNLTVDQIGGIAEIINNVNTISRSIVVAVEQQSATALEIAKNVNATSSNAENMENTCNRNVEIISEIANNISDVHVSAEKTENGVLKNRESIMGMHKTVEDMKNLVGRFKIE